MLSENVVSLHFLKNVCYFAMPLIILTKKKILKLLLLIEWFDCADYKHAKPIPIHDFYTNKIAIAYGTLHKLDFIDDVCTKKQV